MRSGGFILDHWWKAGNHVLPQHLHTLVNAVRDEGGALRTKLFVVCTPLSCNNAGVTRRSLADVSELACLFSTIIIVLCDCHDESILHGLKVHYITVNADVLVCAGLQAGTREQLESDYMDDLMAPSAKVASLLRSNADLVLRTHDHDLECKHLTSSACPCAADHQISPEPRRQQIRRTSRVPNARWHHSQWLRKATRLVSSGFTAYSGARFLVTSFPRLLMKIMLLAWLRSIQTSLLSSLPRSLSLQVRTAISSRIFADCVRWGTRAWPGFSPAIAEAASEE